MISNLLQTGYTAPIVGLTKVLRGMLSYVDATAGVVDLFDRTMNLVIPAIKIINNYSHD